MNPWIDVLDKLQSLGYIITLDGEKLKYAYHGKGNPSKDEISPLLEILMANKGEILNDPYFLIEQAIQEINETYQPEFLKWRKANKPGEWERMLILERSINEMALGSNLKGLREALDEYQGLIFAMVKEFKAVKEKKEQGMFNLI